MDAGTIEYIAQMVLQKLQSSNNNGGRKALVILEGYIDELSVMEDIHTYYPNYDLTMLVLKSVALKETYESFGQVLYAESCGVDISNIIKSFETVILPAPSLNSISKIAHIIVDGEVPKLVFGALESGKQVLISDIKLNKKIMKLNDSLKVEAELLYNKLLGYGISKISLFEEKSDSVREKDFFSKPVLSVRDIENAKTEDFELIIDKDTIITPLAADYIREKKIKVNIRQLV